MWLATRGQPSPDWAQCVRISADGARRQKIVPSLTQIVATVAALLDVGGVVALRAEYPQRACAIVSVVFSGFIVKFSPTAAGWTGLG